MAEANKEVERTKTYLDERLADITKVTAEQTKKLQECLLALSLSGKPNKEEIEEAHKNKLEESSKKLGDKATDAEKKAHKELEENLNKSREALLAENAIQAQEKELEEYRGKLGLPENPSKEKIETAFITKSEALLKDKPDAEKRKPLEEALTKAKEVLIKESELEENRKLLGVTKRSSNEEIALASSNLVIKYPDLKDKLTKAKDSLVKDNQAKLVSDAKPAAKEEPENKLMVDWVEVGRGMSVLSGKGVGPFAVKTVKLAAKQTMAGARGGFSNGVLFVNSKVKNPVAKAVLRPIAGILGGTIGAALGIPITIGAAINELAVKPIIGIGKRIVPKPKPKPKPKPGPEPELEQKKEEERKEEAALILQREIIALQKQVQDLQHSPQKEEQGNKLEIKTLEAKIKSKEGAISRLAGQTPVVRKAVKKWEPPNPGASVPVRFHDVNQKFEAISPAAMQPKPQAQDNANVEPMLMAQKMQKQRAALLSEILAKQDAKVSAEAIAVKQPVRPPSRLGGP
jgi:hypothetical protein